MASDASELDCLLPGKRPYMWVPREAEVIDPPIILLISRSGFGSVDFRQAMMGLNWIGCYTR